MSDGRKKEIHKEEQLIHLKPKGVRFNLGDYVTINRETMMVYNHLCPKYRYHDMYGFVSYDEETNTNEDRDYIKIVRFRPKDE